MRRRSGWRAGRNICVRTCCREGVVPGAGEQENDPSKAPCFSPPTGSPSLTIRIAEPELSVDRAGTCLRPACLAWDVLQLACPETRLTTYLKGSS